ncbi:TetR/AcrR family transcriptional regulator [Thalassiella azotivora]
MSPRGALSRETIVEAALDHVDRHGLAALTMRRLGADLEVEAMSLYGYVDGREDLLDGMVDALVDGLHLDPARHDLRDGDGWQAYLQWLAHAVRRTALEHPRAFPLVATRHPAAPWLRPPLRSLQVVDDFLGALTSRGFTLEAAVRAYRVFSSFLLGYLLLESAQVGDAAAVLADARLASDAPDEGVDPQEFPLVHRARGLLSEQAPHEDFESALERVLDQIEQDLLT